MYTPSNSDEVRHYHAITTVIISNFDVFALDAGVLLRKDLLNTNNKMSQISSCGLGEGSGIRFRIQVYRVQTMSVCREQPPYHHWR